MAFLNIFKSKKLPTWENLPESQRIAATKKLVSKVKALSGAKYKIVSGSGVWQRERGIIETEGEDSYLPYYKRAQLLDLARNAARNNSTFNTVLKQLDLNAVGTEGGKAILQFQDRAFNNELREKFAQWTRCCDFFDGLNLNTLLKIILKTEIIGGDLVLVFDDGLVEDSGKLLLFEPDEIGDINQDILQKSYGRGATQSLGRVYSQNGRFIGAIVSKSQRGLEVFDASKSWLLHRDLAKDPIEDSWLMPRNIFRVGQGRGITPLTSSLADMMDLQSYVSFEIAAAKKNAQTLAQVIQDQSEEQVQMPTPFDTDIDFSTLTDEQIEAATKEAAAAQETPVSLDQIRAAGTIYQVMPEGTKLELLDTKHPNPNSIEFTKWLAARSAAPFGLTTVFATLKCENSYTAFRGEQILAQPAFEECQHFLEQICDWAFYHWTLWAADHDQIDISRLEGNWLRKVAWAWPQMRQVDPVKEQNAISLKLKNMTGSYLEFYGADWREKLDQISEEIKYCQDHGIIHPSQLMVSGGQVKSEQLVLQDDVVNNEDDSE